MTVARFISLELDRSTVAGIPAWRENSYAYIRTSGDCCSKCNADTEVVGLIGEVCNVPMRVLLCADCVLAAISDGGGL